MSRYFVRTPRIVTSPLLELLREPKVQATFFLLGKNAEKYPELVQRILEENHSIGFHCNEHTNSRKLNLVELLKNFKLPNSIPSTLLYRPPYGKLRIWQYNYLKNKFPLIGWTLMPGDFDTNKKFETQLNHLKSAQPGDIIVLHELPETIELLRAYFEQTPFKLFEKL